MEYIYSAMLLHSAKQPISEENVTKILQAASISPDPAKVKALVASLEGQDIEKLIQEASAAVPTKAEERKEEKKEEEGKKAETAAEGLSALFT